jgi:hypothetical protein
LTQRVPSANLQNLDIFYFSSNFNSFSWWVKKKSYFFSIFMFNLDKINSLQNQLGQEKLPLKST